MKSKLSLSALFEFKPTQYDDGSKEIYSGSFNKDLTEYCLPSPSSQAVFLFGSKHPKAITLRAGKKLFTPDLSIHSSSGEIILGCRESANLAKINKRRDKIDIIELGIQKFYATSFKYNSKGELFVGNLYGDPIIICGTEILTLPIKTDRSYDCIWLDNDNLVVSCMSEGRVVHCRRKNGNFSIIGELKLEQPYRFSPILKNQILLTTRGWIDRPGKIHLLEYDYDVDGEINVTVRSSIVVSDRLFYLKKNLPKWALKLLDLKRYTGYINDVAWVSETEFMVTTKTGGSILIYDTNGNLKENYSKFKSIYTRFIGERLPNQHICVIDTGKKPCLSIVNIDS